MWAAMVSYNASMLVGRFSLIWLWWVVAQPSRAEAYTTGKSSAWSGALSDTNRSNTSFTTSSGRAEGLSLLLMTRMGFKPKARALDSTKRVCGIGPSNESTTSRQPSAMFSTRSTSPPKSACPGVSIRLNL